MIYTCQQCRKEFKDRPSARRIYCSKACHNIAQAKGKTVKYGRAVREKLGRPLAPGEVVHHINGRQYDNRPENLMVMNHGEHLKLRCQLLEEKGGDAICP